MLFVGGENLIDLVQLDQQDGLPLYQAIPGGSPFNLAIAAGRQGLQTGYLTRYQQIKAVIFWRPGWIRLVLFWRAGGIRRPALWPW